MKRYFLINKNFGLIGWHDYESEEAARAAIKDSNIPQKDIEVRTFEMLFLNDRYVHPENYINNDKSRIKPADYTPKIRGTEQEKGG
jgi:hypothetical protein